MQFFQRALSSHKNSVSSLKKTVCLVVKLRLPERILFTQQECVRPIEKMRLPIRKIAFDREGKCVYPKGKARFIAA